MLNITSINSFCIILYSILVRFWFSSNRIIRSSITFNLVLILWLACHLIWMLAFIHFFDFISPNSYSFRTIFVSVQFKLAFYSFFSFLNRHIFFQTFSLVNAPLQMPNTCVWLNQNTWISHSPFQKQCLQQNIYFHTTTNILFEYISCSFGYSFDTPPKTIKIAIEFDSVNNFRCVVN